MLQIPWKSEIVALWFHIERAFGKETQTNNIEQHARKSRPVLWCNTKDHHRILLVNLHVLTWNGFSFQVFLYIHVPSGYIQFSDTKPYYQIRSDHIYYFYIILLLTISMIDIPQNLLFQICIKVVCGNTPTMFFLDDVSFIVQKNRPMICCLGPLCRLTPPNQGISW